MHLLAAQCRVLGRMQFGQISLNNLLGIQRAFPDTTEFFAWFESFHNARAAVEDLKAYIAREGPFDGVLGFSQGAQLAATLMFEEATSSTPHSLSGFRFAIFICGIEPWSLSESRPLDPAKDGEYIFIPAANMYSQNDQEHFDGAVALSALCSSRTKVCVDHGGAHEIPRGAETTKKMAQAISTVIEKAADIQ